MNKKIKVEETLEKSVLSVTDSSIIILYSMIDALKRLNGIVFKDVLEGCIVACLKDKMQSLEKLNDVELIELLGNLTKKQRDFFKLSFRESSAILVNAMSAMVEIMRIRKKLSIDDQVFLKICKSFVETCDSNSSSEDGMKAIVDIFNKNLNINKDDKYSKELNNDIFDFTTAQSDNDKLLFLLDNVSDLRFGEYVVGFWKKKPKIDVSAAGNENLESVSKEEKPEVVNNTTTKKKQEISVTKPTKKKIVPSTKKGTKNASK